MCIYVYMYIDIHTYILIQVEEERDEAPRELLRNLHDTLALNALPPPPGEEAARGDSWQGGASDSETRGVTHMYVCMYICMYMCIYMCI